MRSRSRAPPSGTRVGAVDDGIRAGLTRLTQHMILDGNVREPGSLLRRDVYAAAAELEVVTGVHRAMFILRAPRQRFTALAERMLTLTLDAEIDQRAEERCKTLTLRDELDGSSPLAVESLVAGELLLAGKGAPAGADYRNPVYGDADIVRQLTVDDVKGHLRRYFRPANATVVVTGAFDRAPLRALVKSLKGGKASRPLSPQQSAALPLTIERWAGRSAAYDLHRVQIADAEAAAAARVLLITMEDRLRRRLPEPSAAAAVHAYPMLRSWMQAVVVSARGGRAETDAAFSSTRDALAAAEFSPGEYERTRTVALRELEREDRRSRDLALVLVVEGTPVWHTRDTQEALTNLSQADFMRHVRVWLKPEHKVVVHVGRSYAQAKR